MLKKCILISAVCLSALNVFATDTPASRAVASLAILDVDGDGALCLMECTPKMTEHFKEFDVNKDSYLSLEELTAYYTKSDQNSAGEK